MILQELKKIWTPMRIVLLIVVSVLMYSSFLAPIVHRFKTESGIDAFQEKMKISKEWIARYGNTIEAEEFFQIEKEFEKIKTDISASMSKKDIFVQCGIETYEEFLAYGNNALNGKAGFAYQKYREMQEVLFEGTPYHAIYLQEYETMIKEYTKNSKGQNSVLPYEVIVYTTDFLLYLALWCLIVVLLLSAPVMVNDVASNMNREQYSSKVGRSIYIKQYGCTIVSVLLAELIVIAIGMIAWKTTNTSAFLKTGLDSFMYLMEPTLNMNYGALFVCFIAIMLLLGIGIGSMAFCLSARSSHMIAMLIKITPVAVVAGIYIFGLENAFFKENVFYSVMHIAGIEMILAGIFAVFGIIWNMFQYKDIKKGK